jgi:hypothetical protein
LLLYQTESWTVKSKRLIAGKQAPLLRSKDPHDGH